MDGQAKGVVIALGSGAAERAAAFAAQGYLVRTFVPPDGDDGFAALQASVDEARAAGRVALVGYGAGGALAYAAGNRVKGLACVVADGGPAVLSAPHEKRRSPTLLQFFTDDPATPVCDISLFRSRRPDVSAFLNSGRAAPEAEARSLDFVAQFVVGSPPATMKNAGAYAQAKGAVKPKKKGDDLGPPE